MVDLLNLCSTMLNADREDRALQRCNPSARSMPGDGQEHRLGPVLLPSHPSSGFKAINLLTWVFDPSQVKQDISTIAVGHMSRLPVRLPSLRQHSRELLQTLAQRQAPQHISL